MSRTLLWRAGGVIALVALVGCGERALSSGDAGLGHDAGGQGTNPDATAKVAADAFWRPTPTTQSVCGIGIRVDDCCTSAEPMLTSAIAQDPCVVPWPVIGAYADLIPTIPAACEAKHSPHCGLVDCSYGGPRSRKVELVGNSCQFVDECQTDQDCQMAWNANGCCDCDWSYPKTLVNRETCLVPSGNAVPDVCASSCGDNQVCEGCGPPGTPRCSVGDEIQVCYANR